MSWEVANYIINKTKENIDELSSKEITSTDPYTYRKSLGNLADMEIVGASVGWNQQAREINSTYWSVFNSSYTSAAFDNGIATITITTTPSSGTYRQGVRLVEASKFTIIAGHKYFVTYKVKPSVTCNFVDEIFGSTGAHRTACTANVWNTVSFLENPQADKNSAMLIYPNTLLNANDTYQIKDIILIDLTILFGSTIADAIYAMEQATEGAGVAFFRKYFPKDYYVYDAGSIQSVSVGNRKVVGKNLIESKISGVTIGTEGKIKTSSGYSVSIAKVIEDETYIVSTDDSRGFVGAFFKDLPVLGSISYNDTRSVIANKVFTAPISGYVAFLTTDGYAFSQCEYGTTATPYEPYTSTAYPFDSTKELRGMFTLVGGELKASGDIYSANGNIQRNYGIVDLGTLDWTYSNSVFSAIITGGRSDTSDVGSPSNMVCSKYSVNPLANSDGYSGEDKALWHGKGSACYVRVRDSAYSDAETFKTAMSGVYLVYELATPTTESAQSYQNPQRAYIDGTEEFTDGLTRDVMIPVGNTTTYQQDNILPSIEDYVDSITDTKTNISAIAPEENGATASKAYSVGQHFYKNGKFCTAIVSIAINSSFTLNTNYVEGTIAEAIEGKKAVLDIDPSAATISAYEVGTMWLKTQ